MKEIPTPPRLASSPQGMKVRHVLGLLAAAGTLLGASSARAGTVTYDFTTDPTTGPNAIQVFQSGFADDSGNSVYWKASGGNPGGFLGITWPIGGSSTIALFPDIDSGKTVTAFKFETDLRVGNPQQTDRAADGFSINFARKNDDVFVNHASGDFATSGAVETGTKTGLAISFDTWSGNTLPDGADIEGIIVRVDNITVLRYPMPTRNGSCDDVTSLQTGPRDTAYWDNPDTGAKALGTLPGAAFLEQTWTNLCWAHLSVELDDQSKLTVIYKGKTVLDHFQTTFFPSPGGIVLAGRTGGADEHTHFDNLKLTTTASTDSAPPTAASNLKAAQVKARKVGLTWTAGTDDSGRVGYNIYRDGTLIKENVPTTSFDDRAVVPQKTYSYTVEAIDPSQNKAAKTAPLSVTTPAEVLVDLKGFATFETWDNIGGTPVDGLTSDPRYPDAPTFKSLATALDTRTVYADDSHENYGGRLTALLTPETTDDYDFFLRSDDASQLFLSTDDKAANLAQIAEETGCCAAFQEPGDPKTTAAPIKLTAGKSYLIQVLWKEGGGGDYAQVAWRKKSDTTAASLLSPIPGKFLSTKGDPTAGPPVITKAPKGTEAPIGGSATFTVEANAGEDPKTYQWSFAGSDIAGATSASYTVNNVTVGSLGLYKVTVSNGEGSVSASAALFIKGTLFIEAEDFDYNSGQTVTGKPIGMDGAYPGGDFRDKGSDADAGIDWNNGGGNAGQPYRSTTGVAAGKPNQHPDGIPRGSFDVTVNHVVGWNDDGDWQNYTRTFPAAADYNVYARLSSGGNPIHSEIDEVTGGVGTANQTLKKLGEFNPKRATAGWDSMEYFPLVDDAGAPVVIKGWGGKKTIRWATIPGANQDIDYIMFIPAGGAAPGGAPKLSIAVTGGKVVITFEGKLQSSATVNGTYADVAGATSPLTADTSSGAKFYRAVK